LKRTNEKKKDEQSKHKKMKKGEEGSKNKRATSSVHMIMMMTFLCCPVFRLLKHLFLGSFLLLQPNTPDSSSSRGANMICLHLDDDVDSITRLWE
jgi:hypothetical protein